ncbi:diuretic hormone receptor-like isoform X2 [Condylostylus longicornis]|uniref:diuretic hormone receptor-like isoform X2 n=1 Tax=Condylostylus longicornis TaxID=2530218 RepID=UPI00244DC2F9|nr:diuretic hormone receptor-like isoform X2 [Condylostylus longicornis]
MKTSDETNYLMEDIISNDLNTRDIPIFEQLKSITNNTEELKCYHEFYNHSTITSKISSKATDGDSESFCPFSFDSVLCWPKTSSNTFAIIPCLRELNGVKYDGSQNATRFCFENGTWSSYSNYDQCRHIATDPSAIQEELPTIIYCTGYFLSLIGLTLALIVFVYFKDLKCLRNTIHANLFLTYILSASLWILTLFLQVMAESPSSVGCGILVLLYHYFQLTNFFWMLVEGLYLYTLVVQTFSSDNIKFAIYAFIGWGCPAIIVVIWSIAKMYTPALKPEYFAGLQIDCLWLRESDADWVHIVPTCLVLILNLIFLIRIMWVLITKLRSANTQETRQYRKASKALLVLIPLLGITYLLVLEGPSHGLESHIFNAVQALLISTQGLSVSVFFCFLNSEVRQALRHKLEIWHDARNISTGSSTRNRSRYKLSKDYSPRSRTESLRTEECSIFIRP